MNMRLIRAAQNAVALDALALMNCDAQRVPHRTNLVVGGYGATDLADITLEAQPIAEVRKTFAGPAFACLGG
ncbi:MAG: hypothetical protein JXP73_14625 [Deltaproteobacteria bacterium]|jgi:hypothetical protein|nr:hypothetical protein [Deltaproteobacteria bacterium]